MTKKRFTFVDNFSPDEAGMDIFDNYTEKRYNEYHMFEVCELLNEIHSENQNISKKEYGNQELSDFDKTLLLQCREYIKLSLLDEELKSFKDYDEDSFEYKELIEDNKFKANLLLMEIYASLMRLKHD